MSISISDEYKALKKLARHGIWTGELRDGLESTILKSLEYLDGAKTEDEHSLVPGKSYAAFHAPGKKKPSRVVNVDLYDSATCRAGVTDVLAGRWASYPGRDLEKILYTAAMSFCCARDIESGNTDRSGPGTFFEYLVGNVLATALDVRGIAKMEALNPELAKGLRPDHLFDLGTGKAIIHLAVKTSSRERIVQPWAHQRILDGAYGTDRIKGVMVFLTETNRVKNGVQETCTPERLRQYQMFVARIHSIYYFDPPESYLQLADDYPFVPVKRLAELPDGVDGLKDPSPWN